VREAEALERRWVSKLRYLHSFCEIGRDGVSRGAPVLVCAMMCVIIMGRQYLSYSLNIEWKRNKRPLNRASGSSPATATLSNWPTARPPPCSAYLATKYPRIAICRTTCWFVCCSSCSTPVPSRSSFR
jgi:hypothetical protein